MKTEKRKVGIFILFDFISVGSFLVKFIKFCRLKIKQKTKREWLHDNSNSYETFQGAISQNII